MKSTKIKGISVSIYNAIKKYVNPKIEELDVMKENINLERKRICK